MDYRIVSADDHIDMAWLPRDLCDNARQLYGL